MGAYGYADGQSITGWLGVPLVEQTALAIGAGTQDFGPFPLTNFASVIVAVKPTGGQVTVKVKQTIGGGPASLELDETFVVPAGATAFEAIVLFADTVTVELVGGAVGTTVDFAVYPSNTTTNAQVITQATINVQHNDALVAAEPTLDFEDNDAFVWAITDDALNTRVKITPPAIGAVKIGSVVLAAPAATIAFGGIVAAAGTLALQTYLRTTSGNTSDQVMGQVNADAAADYSNCNLQAAANGLVSGGGLLAQTSITLGNAPGGAAPAGAFSSVELEIPNFGSAVGEKPFNGRWQLRRGAAGADMFAGINSGAWFPAVAAAVAQLVLTPGAGSWATGSRADLYRLP